MFGHFSKFFAGPIALFLFLGVITGINITSIHVHPLTSHSTPRFAKESERCNNLLVTLHGNNPPTVECLDKQISNATPFTGPGGCPGDLELFENIQDQGANICFDGTGDANLTDFCMPWYEGGCLYGTWNDRASSYIARNHAVLWTDIDEGGSGYEVFAGQGNDFTGIWNDVMSSVHIGDGFK